MIDYMSKPNNPQESQMPATLTPVPAEFLSGANVPMATPSQLEWIGKCRNDRVLTDEMIAFIDAKLDASGNGISKRRASELLDKLFALPRKSVERATTVTDRVSAASPFKTPDIPTGRYALRNDANPENDIEFYSVYRFDDGGLSLKRFASDERYPVKGAARMDVLKAIAVDINGAAQLYGRETCHCGRCAKLLTRRVSRTFGVGPDCAEAMGISGAYDALAASLKAQGLDPDEKMA